MKYYTQKSLNEIPVPKNILALKEAQRIKEKFEGKQQQDQPFDLNGTGTNAKKFSFEMVKENIANSF